MNRGRLTPQPQSAVAFGIPGIQQQAGQAVNADRTTPGALIGILGAPRTAFVVTPYQPPLALIAVLGV